MKSPTNIAHTFADTVLSEHELEMVRQELIHAPEEVLNGRAVLAPRQIGADKRQYQYTVVSKYGDAQAVKPGSDAPGLKLDGVESTVEIPKYFMGFDITREDVLASKSQDKALNTRYAEQAGIKIKQKENDVIWNGDTRFGINGIVADASKSNTGTNWTAGTTQYTDTIDSVNSLGNNYDAKAAVFNKTQHGELYSVTAYTDKTYREKIVDGLGLQVMWDKAITAASAVIMDVGKNIAELAISEDMSLEIEYKTAANQSWHGIGWVRSAPAILDGNAICSLTTI